jgi:hypothetical protein
MSGVDICSLVADLMLAKLSVVSSLSATHTVVLLAVGRVRLLHLLAIA